MANELPEIVRAPLRVAPRVRRRPEERLALRFPRTLRFLSRYAWRLPVSSKLRQAVIGRAARSGWEGLNRGDLDVAFALYHPDCTSTYPPEITTVGIEAGTHDLASRKESQRRVIEEWVEFRFDPDELLYVGRERLLMTGRMKAVGAESGVPVDMPWLALMTTQDGQVIREDLFLDRAAAYEAAGLDQPKAQM